MWLGCVLIKLIVFKTDGWFQAPSIFVFPFSVPGIANAIGMVVPFTVDFDQSGSGFNNGLPIKIVRFFFIDFVFPHCSNAQILFAANSILQLKESETRE
jgi:hypothetical protein